MNLLIIYKFLIVYSVKLIQCQSMGREAKINSKLTPKQLTFIKCLLSGQSATQAALGAYNTTSNAVAASMAHENLNKPDIRQAIQEALSAKGLSSDVIVANIGNIAMCEPAKISGETKLKANVELLKLMGAYADTKGKATSVSIRSQVSSLTYDQAVRQLNDVSIEAQAFIADAQI